MTYNEELEKLREELKRMTASREMWRDDAYLVNINLENGITRLTDQLNGLEARLEKRTRERDQLAEQLVELAHERTVLKSKNIDLSERLEQAQNRARIAEERNDALGVPPAWEIAM
jgi:chromosome segregation ATPase